MNNNNYLKTAILHHTQGNWNKAREIYEHLLKSNPNDYSVLQNYGPLLAQLREYSLAKNIFEKCLKINPKDSLLLYNFGKFLHERKIFDKAIDLYKKSFDLNSKNDACIYNLGNIYFSLKKFDDAIAYFKKTIEINPSNFLAYNNIGLSLKKKGHFKEALKFYKKAIDINQNYIEGHINYSTLLLSTNNLDEGFKEYEWRKKSKIFSDYLNYAELKMKSPIWNGEELNEKTILIFAEQGIGDLIQFSRYLFLLRDTYKCKVVLRLKQNLSHFFDNTLDIITEDEKIPNHDYHNHLASLPGIFYKKYKNFPKTVNFIREDKEKNIKWDAILKKYERPKIGINASASSATSGDRIIPLENFKTLTKLKNLNFFVIQKDFHKNEIHKININSNVYYFEKLDKTGKAFQDTISLIKNLDLIITADTSLGHLSATLGKPTWIVLSFISDWRWFNQDNKSVWYDNVTLFKQKKIGDWNGVFNLIEQDLEKKF